MPSYEVVAGPGISLEKAQALEQVLDTMMDQLGTLDPMLLVEQCRPENHPLHDEFTWDDSRAAQERRLDQARGLIRRCRVVRLDDPSATKQTLRKFVRVTTEEGKKYATIDRAMSDDELRTELKHQARLALLAWRRKYNGIRELAGVYEVIDRQLELEAEPAPRRAASGSRRRRSR